MGRVRNEDERRRTGIDRDLASRDNHRVLI